CSGRAVVVAQPPAQPLAAPNVNTVGWMGLSRDQPVAEPLMVPLSVVVCDELIEGAKQLTLAEKDQTVETLRADRAHEALRVSIGIRSLDMRLHDPHSRALNDATESLRPLAVPVADEDPPPHGPRHESLIWRRRRARDVDPSASEIEHEERVVGNESSGSP